MRRSHQKALKTALLKHYSTIQEGKPMKRKLFLKKASLSTGLALGIIALSVAGFSVFNSTPLTTKKVFAEAKKAQVALATNGKRYLYQKTISKTKMNTAFGAGTFGSVSVAGGAAGMTSFNISGGENNNTEQETITERWYDTETKNERTVITTGKDSFVSMTVDGKLYTKLPDISLENEKNPVMAFYSDTDDTGFPNGYAKAGITKESLDTLTFRQADEKLKAVGLPALNEGLSGQPAYDMSPQQISNLSSEEMAKAYGLPQQLSAEFDREQCIANFSDAIELGKMDAFYTNIDDPVKLASAFEELTRSDRFSIVSQTTINGHETIGVQFKARSTEFGNYTVYFDKNTYQIVKFQNTLPNMGEFEYTITDQYFTDEPFSLDTTGLEAMDMSVVTMPSQLDVKPLTAEEACSQGPETSGTIITNGNAQGFTTSGGAGQAVMISPSTSVEAGTATSGAVMVQGVQGVSTGGAGVTITGSGNVTGGPVFIQNSQP